MIPDVPTEVYTESVELVSTRPILSASQAQDALADFVTEHPTMKWDESAEKIFKEPMGTETSGKIKISGFRVDLDKKTYVLFLNFLDEIGSDFYNTYYEVWRWKGTFSLSPDGAWSVNPPAFERYWEQ